jgi:cbb3-type cytochrome oxidase subunit 3
MKLSDVMSHSGLTIYAEIAMVLFVLAFIAIVIRVFRLPKRDVDRAAAMPLDDETTGVRREGDPK